MNIDGYLCMPTAVGTTRQTDLFVNKYLSVKKIHQINSKVYVYNSRLPAQTLSVDISTIYSLFRTPTVGTVRFERISSFKYKEQLSRRIADNFAQLAL